MQLGVPLRNVQLLRREDRLRGVSPMETLRSICGMTTARRDLRGVTRLHLGCGDHILANWANVDLIGFPGVVPWNLTAPLPVAADSIDYIFSEHFLEHISFEEGQRHLADCYTALRPGGVLRISTPDLHELVDAYEAGATDRWADVDWHPQTPCQLLNEAMHAWGHLFVYDYGELSLQMQRAGFRQVERSAWRKSRHDVLNDLELRPFHGELIVEATK